MNMIKIVSQKLAWAGAQHPHHEGMLSQSVLTRANKALYLKAILKDLTLLTTTGNLRLFGSTIAIIADFNVVSGTVFITLLG